MTIGEYIKQYLEEHEISQRQFARSTGLSTTYINMLINGINSSTGKPMMPSYPNIAKIAKCMGMSVDALINSVDDFEIYMPPEAPTAEDYAAAGIAARTARTPKTQTRKKTEIDEIIDRLLVYQDENVISPDEQRLLDVYRHLTDKQKEKAIKIIDAIGDD